MELVLLAITSLSLLLALAMGAALWHILRNEQARSEARIALLKEAAGDVPEPMEDGLGTPERAFAADSGMFASSTAASSWRSSTAILIAVALAGAAAVVLTLRLVGAPAAATPLATAAEARPLELLTLGHSPDEDSLTVSGIARNPSGSPRRTGLVVVATALDATGREIGSSRSGLDYPVLEPGGESPFVIKVAVAGSVSRYRVGFRSSDGMVIAHVDRRSADASRSHSTTGGGPWVH
jgi:hypothetical protein